MRYGVVIGDECYGIPIYIKAEITYETDVEGKIEIIRKRIGDIHHILDAILVMQDLLIGGAIG